MANDRRKLPPGYDLGTAKGGLVFKWRADDGTWRASKTFQREQVHAAAWAHHEAVAAARED